LIVKPGTNIKVNKSLLTDENGQMTISFTAGTPDVYTIKAKSEGIFLGASFSAIFTGQEIVVSNETIISGGNVEDIATTDYKFDADKLNQYGIIIGFSNKVSPGTSELKVKDGELIGTEAKWEDTQVTLTLAEGKKIKHDTTYIVSLTGVKDPHSRDLKQNTVTFTTKDKIPPKISGGNVMDGGKDVDPTLLNEKGIVIEFSEKVNPSAWELKIEDGEIIPTEASWEGRKFILIPLAGKKLSYKTTYAITFGGVKDLARNLLILNDRTIKFTTREKGVLQPTLTLSSSKTFQVSNPSQKVTYSIDLKGLNKFKDTVTLTTADLPANVTADFTTKSVELTEENASQKTKLELTLSKEVAIKTHTFTILATSGDNLTKKLSLQLKVEDPPSLVETLELSADPTSLVADGTYTAQHQSITGDHHSQGQ